MEAPRYCPNCNIKYGADVRFCGNCGAKLINIVRAAVPSDPLIGSLIGDRFVVIEKIGQGGMGVVYRAEQTGIWRQVALKVLRPRYSRDRALHERFRIEAATASRLTHPNTITIYDFGVTNDGGLYIAMEMLDGVSLDQEIKKLGAIDWERACRLGIQLCGSLHEAHESSILHRDLKPENIMLAKRGLETDIVKVLDFGIAKIMTAEGDSSQPALTAGNELFGTPEYMSPEQIRGDKLDARSDIYSLGIIFYRMLSGQQPFPAPTPIAVLTKQLTEAAPSLIVPETQPAPPKELTSLVMSCMEKARENRPSDMAEIAETLRYLLGETATFDVRWVQAGGAQSPRAPRPPRRALSTTLQPKETDPIPDTPVRPPAPRPAVVDNRETDPGVAPEALLDMPSDDESDDDELEDDTDQEVAHLPLKEATLALLTKRMKTRKDFPAMSQNVVELNTKALREDTSAAELSNVIIKDFALTSKLLRLVNSPFYGQYRGRVMTVSRAVVIMGFEEVRQLALGLMMFDRLERVQPKQAKVLKDEALSSLTSSLVARKLAVHAGGLDPEAVAVCAMFHKLGKYIAYFYLPKKSREIRRLMAKSHMSESAAALKILGISFTEIGTWVSKEWRLPDQIAEAMTSMPKGPLSKPKGTKEKTRMMVGFAEELITVSQETHPGNRATALKTLARRFGKILPTSETELDDIMMTTTGEIREYAKLLSLNLRDSRFVAKLLNWNGIADIQVAPLEERFSDAPELDILEDDIPEDEETDSFAERKRIFAQGIEEITLAMTSRYDLNGLILMILETMYRGLGLSRVVFFLNDIKTNTMIARSGFGEGVEELIRQFRFQPRRGRDIFNQAVWRGKDIIINDTSQPRHKERLPAWYRRATTAPAVVLYPVMLKNVPAGLFYGDVLSPEQRVNRGLLLHMDRLRNLTARGIREKHLMG